MMPVMPALAQVPRTIYLPAPKIDGNVSVERALHLRRSVRSFTGAPVTIIDLAQVLWAAQGITEPNQCHSTAPSAGALYPLTLFIVASASKDLQAGIYRYEPAGHALVPIQQGDKRMALAKSTFGRQLWIANAPIILILTGNYNQTARKYGARAKRYVHIEAGHVAQNVYLQVQTLDLGTTAIGAFDDNKVLTVLKAGPDETPLLIMPVGHPLDP
jgi:SagB-type dehydrogenase family enzyme